MGMEGLPLFYCLLHFLDCFEVSPVEGFALLNLVYSSIFYLLLNYSNFFLICFLASSLLVHRITDFCVLILYPDILMNMFLSCKKFSFEVFRVLSIGSLQLGKIWLLSLFIILLFLSHINVLVKTSGTILNESGDRGHP